MFTFTAVGAGKVYVVRAEGVLTDADYQELNPKLDAAIAEHGAIRLLMDITAWTGMEPLAMWDDFMIGVRHWNDFERIAVLGDADWQDVMTRIAGAVMAGEMRYFEAGRVDDAMTWLKS